MFIKRLHVDTKVFFSDPYMVRVQFDGAGFDEANKRYKSVIKRTYKLVSDTWGYSRLTFEDVKDRHRPQPPPSQLIGLFNGLTQIVPTVEYYTNTLRGYVCFKDEADALQFRLSVDTQSMQVLMWPSGVSFTIHEYIKENES